MRKVTKSGVQTTSVMFNYLVAPTVLQNDADGLPRIKTGLGIWQIPLTSAASARTLLVTKSSVQLIPTRWSPTTTITNWNTPTVNEFGNMFNNTTGVFTNTSSKTIRIRANATVLLAYSGSSVEGSVEFQKNNASFVGASEFFFAPSGAAFWKMGPKFTPVITLAPNETLKVTIYQLAVNNLNTHNTGTQLSIEEVF